MDYTGLVDDAKEILRTLVTRQTEVQTKDGRWYEMRILPYQTPDNFIEGVVVTFSEITRLKKALEALEETRKREALEETRKREALEETRKRKYFEAIVNTVRHPLLIMNKDFKIQSANNSFYTFFQVDPPGTEGKLLYDLGNRQWDIPQLRDLLERILPERSIIEDFRVEHEFNKIGRRVMMLNARRLDTETGEVEMILLYMEDVTDMKKP